MWSKSVAFEQKKYSASFWRVRGYKVGGLQVYVAPCMCGCVYAMHYVHTLSVCVLYSGWMCRLLIASRSQPSYLIGRLTLDESLKPDWRHFSDLLSAFLSLTLSPSLWRAKFLKAKMFI